MSACESRRLNFRLSCLILGHELSPYPQTADGYAWFAPIAISTWRRSCQPPLPKNGHRFYQNLLSWAECRDMSDMKSILTEPWVATRGLSGALRFPQTAGLWRQATWAAAWTCGFWRATKIRHMRSSHPRRTGELLRPTQTMTRPMMRTTSLFSRANTGSALLLKHPYLDSRPVYYFYPSVLTPTNTPGHIATAVPPLTHSLRSSQQETIA
jgi:hypothetical protein